MVRILPAFLAGVLVTILALAQAVAILLPNQATADTEQGSMACLDSNGNGFIDITELFDVIDLYFAGTELSSMACLDMNGNGIVDITELFDVIDLYFSGDPIPGRYDALTSDPELPSFIEWNIQPSVSQWEAERVVLAIKLSYQFSKKIGVTDPDETIVVYVDNDLDRLSEWYANQIGWDAENSRRYWENSRVHALRSLITIKTSTPDNQIWEQRERLSALAYQTMYQYIFSAIQNGLAGLLTEPGGFREHESVSVPRWLSVGMAALMGEMVALDYRGITYPLPQNREIFILNAAQITGVTLEDTEILPTAPIGGDGTTSEADIIRTRAISACTYFCGYLASELLASQVGVAGLSKYYMLLEPAMMPRGIPEAEFPRPGWRTAFEEAFGLTIEEFYQLFEDHKAAGFPELTIPD